MKRRTAIGVLGGAILSLAGSPLLTVYAGESNRSRAIASYEALQKYFYVNDGSYLYHEQYPVAATDNAYSYE